MVSLAAEVDGYEGSDAAPTLEKKKILQRSCYDNLLHKRGSKI